jgi:hypothetical protein
VQGFRERDVTNLTLTFGKPCHKSQHSNRLLQAAEDERLRLKRIRDGELEEGGAEDPGPPPPRPVDPESIRYEETPLDVRHAVSLIVQSHMSYVLC